MSPALITTLLTNGRAIDMFQNELYQPIAIARRLLAGDESRQEFVQFFTQTWDARKACGQERASKVYGVVSRIDAVISKMGLVWSQPLLIERPDYVPLSFVDGDQGCWMHELRMEVRRYTWTYDHELVRN